MQVLKPLAIALLTVISVTCYSTDKLTSEKESVALLPNTKGKVIKVIYDANVTGKVTISVFSGNWLLYHRKYKENPFIQPFDLSDLPEGEYQFEIRTPEGRVEKTILITESKIHEVTR